MTTRHNLTLAKTLPGLRLRRIGSRSVHHTHAGRIAVPLEILHDARDAEELPLILSADEAAVLHAELGRVLYPQQGAAS
ncbi:hypothetical protein [Streptomyces sp. NPDC059994]|uniref:hypothetical protein n=1 Tax=Streptomyces sp. NPDC059994 TaxID=3347029 RepID=UPI00367C26F0